MGFPRRLYDDDVKTLTGTRAGRDIVVRLFTMVRVTLNPFSFDLRLAGSGWS